MRPGMWNRKNSILQKLNFPHSIPFPSSINPKGANALALSSSDGAMLSITEAESNYKL